MVHVYDFYLTSCVGFFFYPQALAIVYIFSPFGTYSAYLAQFFNVIIRAISWMMQLMQHSRRLSIFGCVLKPTAVEGAFQNRLSGHRPY